ncbi:hypothetical protein HK096_006349 [Nowakowskiella sp. JEL0078]|nr:hypothetical protein HK096_006349 [Nowakowskiella sp. JEL0078]
MIDYQNLRIGILGIGEMGAAVGGQLRKLGCPVLVDLENRSSKSHNRAALHDLTPSTFNSVLSESVLVLSIVPPKEALGVAKRAAEFLSTSTRKPLYVDCNAVSPDTKKAMEIIFSEFGISFLDSGIIGGPPSTFYNPTFYISGPSQLITIFSQVSIPSNPSSEGGLKIKVAGDQIGAASALKMSYAGISKGYFGILAAMTLSAKRYGALHALLKEFSDNSPERLDSVAGLSDILRPRVHRFDGEMMEISEFLDGSLDFESGDVEGGKVVAGREGLIYEGFAALFGRIARGQMGEGIEWDELEDISRIAKEMKEAERL